MAGRALVVVGAGRALLAKDGRAWLAIGSNGALLAATDIKRHSKQATNSEKTNPHASPPQESCTSCTHPIVSQSNNPSA
eukprot:875898-Pleurochrysis_carterae.AAC.1